MQTGLEDHQDYVAAGARDDRERLKDERRDRFGEVLHADAVLRQLGYYERDTCFVALNLTPEQFAKLNQHMLKTGARTVEEAIVRCLM